MERDREPGTLATRGRRGNFFAPSMERFVTCPIYYPGFTGTFGT
jgi:hypothetical protein